MITWGQFLVFFFGILGTGAIGVWFVSDRINKSEKSMIDGQGTMMLNFERALTKFKDEHITPVKNQVNKISRYIHKHQVAIAKRQNRRV